MARCVPVGRSLKSKWYYLNPQAGADNGKMLFNTKVDGYILGTDGAWQTAQADYEILIAIDSFKGSLSSKEAGEAIKSGILRVVPDADVVISPLADGGEGTVETLVDALGGSLETVRVKGPLFQEVKAHYGILSESEKFQAEIKSDTHRETLTKIYSKTHSDTYPKTKFSPRMESLPLWKCLKLPALPQFLRRKEIR